VPADNKWFTRLVVAAALILRLKSLELEYPQPSPALRRKLSAARAALEREKH
jgi:hypothetical protein